MPVVSGYQCAFVLDLRTFTAATRRTIRACSSRWTQQFCIEAILMCRGGVVDKLGVLKAGARVQILASGSTSS